MNLPKTLYAAVANKGSSDSEFLEASVKVLDLAEDDVRTVGIYQLVETVKVRKVAEVKKA